MKCKNTIAMVLAGAMLLPSNAFAADLSQYKDFPNDWSAKSLEQAIDNGLLNGSNGMIDAKGLLTRAQMAAIVSRSFGAAKTASLDDYRDVLPSAWYYSDMGKAVKMGAFQGANGLLNPDAPITREEAFTVLARAFALEGGGSATLKDFVDGGTVSILVGVRERCGAGRRRLCQRRERNAEPEEQHHSRGIRQGHHRHGGILCRRRGRLRQDSRGQRDRPREWRVALRHDHQRRPHHRGQRGQGVAG